MSRKEYDPMKVGITNTHTSYVPAVATEDQRRAARTVAWYLRDFPEDIKFVLDLLGLAKARQG